MRSWFIPIFVAMLIVNSCGKKGGSSSDAAQLALIKITEYAQGAQLAPTVEDYIDAGLTGISQEECNVLNSMILGLSKEEIDTAKELQELLDAYNIVLETKPLPTLTPSSIPTATPQPSVEPTEEPTIHPTVTPTPQPTIEPSSEPTQTPVVNPTPQPTATPTPQLVVVPTVIPTLTPKPTATPQPSVEPTPTPSLTPTPNTAPIVDAGSDQSIELGQSASLSATASDSDGDALSYVWSENGSVLATTLSFEYTPSSEGNHTLSFSATDEHNATATDSVTVEVTEECDPFSQFVGAC
ncbi:MAG: PKD domain-containing protein [Campylobacterota bacterium]|nr:PKD domain-containing protein [Campylobacterota bacterium]